jgi:uncharacterized protein (DUF2336 family)
MAKSKDTDPGRRKVDRMPAGEAEYETAKQQARDRDPAVRRTLARRKDLRPELLYYLAEDPDVDVRRAVATNAGAPVQADLLLARDKDDQVRAALAAKIVQVAPALDDTQRAAARKLTVEALTVLAQDQLTRVRRVLAEALKDVAHAPPEVVRRLANDREIEVAGPVLQFSPLLTDADLLAIIEGNPAGGALGAISRRQGVRAPVADAVVAAADRAGDSGAITALLANDSAQIREETLDRLIDRAPQHVDWHEPLVRRPKLSAGAVTKLAQFVADSLIERLRDRADLDADTAEAVAATVRRRLADGGAPQAAWEAESARARELNEQGVLGEAEIVQAIATGNRHFVIAALAVRSGLSEGTVSKTLASHVAKAIVAVVWKAGLAMSLAFQVQVRLAGIAPDQALKPAQGGEFPLSEDDLSWQVDLLQAQPGRKS